MNMNIIRNVVEAISILSSVVVGILSLPKILEIHTDNLKKEDKNVLG